jgi:hypothetical protein
LNPFGEYAKLPLTGRVYETTSSKINFAGAQTYAYSASFVGDGLITGSIYMSNTRNSGIEMAGTTSGYVRSVGYEGFLSASSSLGAPGFLMYSGSVLPGSGDNYVGVGLELVADNGYLRFSTNPSRFEVVADSFFVGSYSSQYISGSGGTMVISSSGFYLDENGNVFISGSISASAGYIGGWRITTGTLYSQTGADYVGMSTAGDTRFFAGASSLAGSGSGVFNVKATGDITGSQVLFTGGKIAGFAIATTGITSTDIGIHPAGQTYAFTAGSSNQFNVKHSGQITGSNVLFTGGKVGGWDITSTHIVDDGNILKLDPDGSYIISSSDFQVSNVGAMTASAGLVGGWNITPTSLGGTNLTMYPSGLIETNDFVSGLKGWRIDQTGRAEFDNASIRGTLSTVTFEKETVNAVGGQLWVANSTAVSGSAVGISDVTMSVANASGFIAAE